MCQCWRFVYKATVFLYVLTTLDVKRNVKFTEGNAKSDVFQDTCVFGLFLNSQTNTTNNLLALCAVPIEILLIFICHYKLAYQFLFTLSPSFVVFVRRYFSLQHKYDITVKSSLYFFDDSYQAPQGSLLGHLSHARSETCTNQHINI